MNKKRKVKKTTKIEKNMVVWYVSRKNMVEVTVVKKHRHTADVKGQSGSIIEAVQIGCLYADDDRDLAIERCK